MSRERAKLEYWDSVDQFAIEFNSSSSALEELQQAEQPYNINNPEFNAAGLYLKTSRLLMKEGNWFVAEEITKRAITFFERKKNIDNVFTCRHRLAVIYFDGGKSLLNIENGKSRAEKALRIMANEPAAGGLIRAAIEADLGLMLLRTKRYVEALTCFTRALDLCELSGNEDGDLAARIHYRKASYHLRFDNAVSTDALIHAKKALKFRVDTKPEWHPEILMSQLQVVRVHKVMSQISKAESMGMEGSKTWEHIKNKGIAAHKSAMVPHAGSLMVTIGECYMILNDLLKAEIWLRKGQEIFQQDSRDHFDLILIYGMLAHIYYETDRYETGDSILKRALAELAKESHDPYDPRLGNVITALVRMKGLAGDLDEAEDLIDDHVKLMTKAYGASHRNLIQPLNNYALFYLSVEMPIEAQKLLYKSLYIAEKELGPSHLTTAIIRKNLGLASEQLERPFDALAFYRQAQNILQRIITDPKDSRLVELQEEIQDLMNHGKKKEKEQADASVEEGEELSQEEAAKLSAQLANQDEDDMARKASHNMDSYNIQSVRRSSIREFREGKAEDANPLAKEEPAPNPMERMDSAMSVDDFASMVRKGSERRMSMASNSNSEFGETGAPDLPQQDREAPKPSVIEEREEEEPVVITSEQIEADNTQIVDDTPTQQSDGSGLTPYETEGGMQVYENGG